MKCKTPATARRLSDVLAADNRGFPAGQRFRMATQSNTLVFRVESDAVSSAFATVSSLLRDIELFQEIWLISQRSSARG